MGMFDSFDGYDNLKDHYVKPCPPPKPPVEDNSKLKPCTPKKPYEKYNAAGELIGYYWYYGDTINLEFEIEGEVTYEGNSQYVDAAEFMKEKQVTVELFNYRRELITARTLPGSDRILFEIDKELSKQLIRGNYYCTLTVFDGNGLNKTLFYQEDCTLFVE